MYNNRCFNALANIKGGEDNTEISGKVLFFQKRNGVLVVADIMGLPENSTGNFFAFHIHDGTSCTGKDFSDTGTHFNPDDDMHPFHAGDLPPLLSNDGRAYCQVLTNRFRIEDIIGKTVVIHDMADDFRTQPAGAAGKKIACGVIVNRHC